MSEELKYKIPPGTNRCICVGCGKFIYFVKTEKGKKMPVNGNGTSHFSTCPAAEEFRNRPKNTEKPQEPGEDAFPKQSELDIF